MSEDIIKQPEETAIAEIPASEQSGFLNLLDAKQLNSVYRNAKVLCESQLLPPHFRGKVADTMILMDLAMRMRISLFTLANHAYTVSGKIGISGQLCISLVNSCGRFTPLDFVFVGEQGTREYGCYAVATRLSNNVICKSTLITWGMAVDENWVRNSKWKTMTDQMMVYRAASFFARKYCPDALLGLSLADELRDVYGESQEQKPKRKITFADIEEV